MRMQTTARRGALALLLMAAGLQLGPSCNTNSRPAVGAQLFTSPQTNPIAVASDGQAIYVANTTAGNLTIFAADPPYASQAVIAVGLDPVGIAVRPKILPTDDEIVLVTNHISDSISVVNVTQGLVVQTLQDLDGNGTSTTDEPVGVAFDGPSRALVTLDHPNQVIGIEFDGSGNATLSEDRATLTSQAPRAISVSNGRVYVAAFESGNQSEFTSCGATDPQDYDPNGHGGDGTGCLFPIDAATAQMFAQSPNIGGEVVHNPSIPDRDLFVYDALDFFDVDGNVDAVSPVDVVEGVGTLLYGAEAVGDTVYLTHTDARNKKDGLDALANRMFDNRLAIVSCPGGSCGAPSIVDLEGGANPFGVPVPTPYGIRASGDGLVLVASVAGSDGVAADPGDPSTVNADIPGLVTLDASGNLLGHVQTGAIPQGVALRSDGFGAAQTAYVLNTVGNDIAVVDVSNPAAPLVTATIAGGYDPTPANVRSGRIAFSSARASTSGTFSCESCHPNGNIDQIDWTINSDLGPQDSCDPNNTVCPEPRSTMPIRGLRDTLPLHWVGNLADPFNGTGVGGPEDPQAPDCNLAIDGEIGCARHLVNASLSGVMCDQNPSCASGPSSLAGALDDGERDTLAAFLAAVAFPPGPARRTDDALSSSALTGINDFFLDQSFVGLSCADPVAGCHALPLTVDTNSATVGGFDAPSIRGLWDRHITFSNGFTSSFGNLEENGFSPAAGGMSEQGSLFTTFSFFTPVYNVPANNIWALINEMSVGLPGITGRQLDLTPDNRFDAAVGTALAEIEAAAVEGRITATAGGFRIKPSTGLWTPASGAALTGDQLRDRAVTLDQTLVVTSRLPASMKIGGSERQPLLNVQGSRPSVSGGSTTMTLNQAYVQGGAAVLIDGQRCDTCTLLVQTFSVDVTVSPLPANGLHVVQVHNPNGFASNETPFCVGNGCTPGP